MAIWGGIGSPSSKMPYRSARDKIPSDKRLSIELFDTAYRQLLQEERKDVIHFVGCLADQNRRVRLLQSLPFDVKT